MFVKHFSPINVVLILAAIAAIGASFFLGRFAFDDLYISFRYAEHLATGHGLRWNIGATPVEGYTNFLLVLILTLFRLLGFDLLLSVQILNILLAAASAVIMAKLAMHLLEQATTATRNTASILSAIAFLANPYTWQNALSGLETTLFVFLLLLSLENLWKAKRREGSYYSGFVLCFLLVLTRPDGFLFGLLATVIFAFNREQRYRVLLASLIAFVLPCVLYEVWRISYFGQLLPNTFYVKVGESFLELPGRAYVKSFGLTEIVLPCMLAVGVWKLKRTELFWACVLWCIGLSLFYLLVEPIQGFYFRFLFSVLTVGSLLGVCALVSFTSGLKETYRWVMLSAVLVGHLALNWSMAKGEEVQAVIPEATEMYRELGATLRSLPGADTISFAYQDAGVVPYYSGLRHYDLVGLNDSRIARSSIGEIVRYLREESPDIVLLPTERPEAGDSCWSIFRQGHGKMGELGPMMLTSGMLADYDVVGRYLYIGYDILILVDRNTPSYRSIASSLLERKYEHLVLAGRVPCIQ